MRRILLSEIHETEALSPKSSAASTITFLNQKDSSPSSTISVICLVISVLALITVFLGILHLIFKIFRKSPTFFQIRDFNSNSDLSSSSSPQLQYLFFLHDSGLDQTAVDALPVFIYGDIIMSLKEPFDCAVCLSEFSDSDKLRLLPVCRHAFHLHCIDTWLLANSTCPLCRLSLSASNDAETSIAVPLFDHQHVDEGKASLSERVFSVRLGRFNSTNESQRHEVKGELGMGVPRRCYSMGTRKFLECDQDFVVASREGKTSNHCSGHEGKSVRQDSGGLGSRKESMSVSKIWLWSDKNKRAFQHSLV